MTRTWPGRRKLFLVALQCVLIAAPVDWWPGAAASRARHLSGELHPTPDNLHPTYAPSPSNSPARCPPSYDPPPICPGISPI